MKSAIFIAVTVIPISCLNSVLAFDTLGTPLFTALELESQKTILGQTGIPKAHVTALKSQVSFPVAMLFLCFAFLCSALLCFALGLCGSSPSTIGDLTNIMFLDLSSNDYKDEIPSEIGKLTHLEYLDLNDNNLNGQIGNINGVYKEPIPENVVNSGLLMACYNVSGME
ncbi:hypothetical protein L1887_32769 [Cichorium endivia]|nr:hypothetical protein L1887_32769 [Cichorium endivia]